MQQLRSRKRPRGFPILLLTVFLSFLIFGAPSSFSYYAPLQDVIAWQDGSTVHFKVYDPNLGQWMEGSLAGFPTAVITVKEGIVAWYNAGAMETGMAVYNPSLRSWVISRSHMWATNIIIEDGVIAIAGSMSSTPGILCCRYDGVTWTKKLIIEASSGYAMNAGFFAHVAGGPDGPYVIARVGAGPGYSVHYYEYAPLEALAIDEGGTITWTFQGANYKLGYVDGVWLKGQDTKPKAAFDAPALTQAGAWFTDLSLGATSWHYDFGDGATSTARSPLHTYAQEGTFIVTQTVTGPHGTDTTTRTVKIDNSPASGTIVINGDSPYTNSRNATLSLTAADANSTNLMRFSNDGATWKSWVGFATTYPYTLPSGDGTKTVYVQFQDEAGNISSAYNDSIILDTRPPSPRSVRINAGAAYCSSKSVTLALQASDALSGVSQVRFSNTPADPASWSPWQNYTTAAGWSLTAGDELKTVGVQFKDGAGNVGSAQDTITLDTNDPLNCSIVINAGLNYTNAVKVTLSFYAWDEISGVKQMRFRQYDLQNETPWGTWQTYRTQRTLNLLPGDGRKWVEVQFKDGAGIISPTASDTIILDKTKPIAGTVQAAAGAGQTTLSWSGFSDALSGIKNYLVYFSNQPFSAMADGAKIYEGPGPSFAHTDLTPGKTYYYRVFAQDNAGNISSGAAAQALPY